MLRTPRADPDVVVKPSGSYLGCLTVNRWSGHGWRMEARGHKISVIRSSRFQLVDWLPVFDLSTDDVFRVIHDAGQSPHWIYEHLPRCSCAFCKFSSPEQLRCAAELRPELYRRYAELERRIGHTLSPSRVPLTQLTGIPL